MLLMQCRYISTLVCEVFQLPSPPLQSPLLYLVNHQTCPVVCHQSKWEPRRANTTVQWTREFIIANQTSSASTHSAATSHLAPDVIVPINDDIGDALIDLVDHCNALPIVVSLSPPLNSAAPAIVEWSTVARILGITTCNAQAQTSPVSSLPLSI